MNTIYTFGYGNGKHYAGLISHFKEFDIKALVDVRLSPRAWSWIWYGKNLKKLCSVEGLEYYSFPDLGNTTKTSEWIPPDPTAAEEAMKEVAAIAQTGNIILMCAEKDHQRCHRTAIAQALAKRLEFPVQHLD